ncbi:MAG: hypothetical protein IPM82_31500 [Saprospiraceae bacterium]|nr:hypothetical protein [Saprospiraceae bacterium]
MAYMEWYANLPEEKKAQMHLNSQHFVADKIRHDVKLENPFANKSDVAMRFIELTQREEYPVDVFAFIQEKMAKRSEEEWQVRFKAMKKKLGWSYDQMAKFMGAGSGNAVKASINRQLPASQNCRSVFSKQWKKVLKKTFEANNEKTLTHIPPPRCHLLRSANQAAAR